MRINFEDLNTIKHSNKRIVLATGTFDLFHYEHLLYLKSAKSLGDILIVGIKDNECAKLKEEKSNKIRR